MVAPVTPWGSWNVGLDKKIATARFSRMVAWGGGRGPGVHWLPVSGRAGLHGASYNTIGLVGGPGLPATGFVDHAINQAAEDLKKDIKIANDNLAIIAEDFCNRGAYRTTHEMKVREARDVYGENLWREVADYPPTPVGGVKYGKFNVTETQAMKDVSERLGAGLTPADISKISKLPPLVRDFNVEEVRGGLSQRHIGEYGFTKGDYTFFRSAPTSPTSKREVDVAVMRASTGEWMGFAEPGVSNFRTPELGRVGSKFGVDQPGVVGDIKPGRQLYVYGGSLIQFYVDEGMFEGLTAAAREAQQLYKATMFDFRTRVKAYASTNFSTMVRGRSRTRSGRHGFHRSKENTFDPLVDIAVNIRIPSPNNEVQRYHLGIYYHHPVATAWNYGLMPGPRGVLAPIQRGQRTTATWRLAPPREQTIID